MTTFAMGGWQYGVNLKALLDRARMLARISSYAHLGANASDQNARVAELVSEAVQEFTQENPAPGTKTATVALAAGTQAYAIPTDLQGCQIERIAFENTGLEPAFDGRTIPQALPSEEQALPLAWRNGAATEAHPQRWALDDTGANIVFYPVLAASRNVTVSYHQEPTAVTAANVAAPDAVTIGEVPVMALRVLALKVAADLADGIDDALKASRLEEYQAELIKVQQKLNTTHAAERADNVSAFGMGPLATGGLFENFQQGYWR